MTPSLPNNFSAVSDLRSAHAAYDRFGKTYAHLLQHHPLQIAVDRDEENQILYFLTESAPPLPLSLTDDFRHLADSLRSLFEHIATALAITANNGDPLPKSSAGIITFPMSRTESAFRKRKRDLQKYFRPEDWHLIEKVQPCFWKSPTWGDTNLRLMPSPYSRALVDIDDYAKKTRHRSVSLVNHQIENIHPPDNFDGQQIKRAEHYLFDEVKIGQPLACWVFDQLPDRDPTPQELGFYIKLRPSLTDSLKIRDCLGPITWDTAHLGMMMMDWLAVGEITMQLFNPSMLGQKAESFDIMFKRMNVYG